jgi:hypothetical protein
VASTCPASARSRKRIDVTSTHQCYPRGTLIVSNA